MKNKFFIFVVIILVVAGIYFIVKKPAYSPTNQEYEKNQNSSLENTMNGMETMNEEEMMNHEQMPSSEKTFNHTVNYNGKNFTPSSLEIKVGEIVKFSNQSDGGMWVASGSHPSHDIYPEFDAKKNIPSGGIYEFKFTKVGEWKYHNHTNPNAFGTIIVK